MLNYQRVSILDHIIILPPNMNRSNTKPALTEWYLIIWGRDDVPVKSPVN